MKIHLFLLIVLIIFASTSLGADQSAAKTDAAASKLTENTTDEVKSTPTKKEPKPNPTPKPETTPTKDGDNNEDNVLFVTETSTEIYDPTQTGKPVNSKHSGQNQNTNLPAILGGSIGGGVVILLLIGFIIYKLRQSNRKWEDEEYLKTSTNPFKSTLEQYHANQ